MQFHSQTVGHRKRCDETQAFHKMCNVTHSLLVIGTDVQMRLPLTKCALNVTHKLLVIGKDMMGLLFTECAMSHSLAVDCHTPVSLLDTPHASRMNTSCNGPL